MTPIGKYLIGFILLSSHYVVTGRLNVLNCHGGIWSYIAETDRKTFALSTGPSWGHYQLSEIKDYLSDISVLDEFPVHPLPAGSAVHLKYKTWNEYTKTLKAEDIPGSESIPPMWDLSSSEEETERSVSSELWEDSRTHDFPFLECVL